jgi:drug/metabolite transporter (DMT)-like permease
MQPSKLAPLALLGYILLRGCDASVLKWLQERGAATLLRTDGAVDPIGFSNVFFYSNLATGLVILLLDQKRLRHQLPQLAPKDQSILCLRAFLGGLVGPICYFQALKTLSVSSQTLLFTLILPATALLAKLILQEPLPRRFGLSLALLPAGLLISHGIHWSSTTGPSGHDLNLGGMSWSLVSVLAFSVSGILNRVTADKNWGTGLTIGLTNLLVAAVFGAVTLIAFGPEQFLYMRWWWLFGLLLIYTTCISLGGELLLLASYRGLGAITVALWGNAVILVALVSANIVLSEPLNLQTLLGAAVISGALLMTAGTPKSRSDSLQRT